MSTYNITTASLPKRLAGHHYPSRPLHSDFNPVEPNPYALCGECGRAFSWEECEDEDQVYCDDCYEELYRAEDLQDD
jgi:uncharacterized paraquat-inducible protein A